MAGLTVLAIGIAGNSPILDGFAAQQPNVTASEGLSVSEAGQLPGFFVSPALIGAVAGTAGLRYALVLPVLTLAGMALLAGRLKVAPGSAYSDGEPRRSRPAGAGPQRSAHQCDDNERSPGR